MNPARDRRWAVIVAAAASILSLQVTATTARIHRTFTSAAYFSNRALRDSTEARFLAEHYDIYIGQDGDFAPYLRRLNKGIFGQSVSSRFYEWAKGPDPSNPKHTFHIYARSYEKAFLLVKLRQSPDDPWDRTTATVHELRRTCRPLLVDGTLGPPITSVRLRNDEAVILVP